MTFSFKSAVRIELGCGNAYIYTLIDPRNNEVFYVGQSIDPRKRFNSYERGYRTPHTFTGKPRFLSQDRRFDEIIDSGLKPLFLVIYEVGPDENPFRYESRLIAHYRFLGNQLINVMHVRSHGPKSRRIPTRPYQKRKENYVITGEWQVGWS